MFQFELPIAVQTLDKKELLPAGTLVTEQVAADVAALGRLQKLEYCELLQYGTVRDDMTRFLEIPPYLDIYSDKKLVEKLLVRMSRVKLPLPLLKALDYFRQHDIS